MKIWFAVCAWALVLETFQALTATDFLFTDFLTDFLAGLFTAVAFTAVFSTFAFFIFRISSQGSV